MNTHDYKIQLGKVVTRRRQVLGLSSQESLAAAVGLHRTYIGAIERGERNISLENLVLLSIALEMPLSELLKAAERAVS